MTNLLVIHGDNIELSRDQLLREIEGNKKEGRVVLSLDGKSINAKDLETALLSQSLFEEEVLVIEGLLSRPRSTEKDRAIELLTTITSTKPIILWEAKKLTPAALKPFVSIKASIKEHKLSTSLFKLLDSLKPGSKQESLALLHTTLTSTPDIVVFTLISRRISDLIIAVSSPSDLKQAPWQKSGLIRQAKKWELRELAKLISKLIDIDWSVKKGLTSMTFADHLDLFVLAL